MSSWTLEEGCFVGHDVITRVFGKSVGLSKIRQRFNVVLGNSSSDGGDVPFNRDIGGQYIKIAKKGMLTDTPWAIGDIGTVLHVPSCHQTDQFTFGDIWMTFDESRLERHSGSGDVQNHKYNFYLTSYNNTAMIQTGHSNGNATPDEQKVLANTLFYLKQLTSETFSVDNSARDYAAPNPVTEGIFTDSFEFTNPGDNGSTYRYYVENINKGTRSNSIASTITTGVAGYAYTIDENPINNNVPTTVMLTEEKINLLGIPKVNEKWIHIRTIDNAGNSSAVTHFKIKLGHSDLALRQFISEIERDGTKYTVNREPQVDVSPIKTGGTTANYTHNKWQEWVKRNDIVTYTIRIYNEGMFTAYTDEINVYLPSGLEFIYSNTNREYGWSLQGTNHIYTNYSMNKSIEKFIYYDDYGNKQYKNQLSYIDLKLECKVASNVGPYTILTNLAEITKYHVVDDKGEKITWIDEIDSNPDNLNVPNDIDKSNYSENQEDDDDFEKVQIMYTDVQGNVWIDNNDNKPKVQNMLVKLTDTTDGSTSITRTYGEGYYEFKNIRVDHTFTIEFEYDGQTYKKSQQTASYASENLQDREKLNNRFYEITTDNARNKENEKSIVNLEYNTQMGETQVNRNKAPFNKGINQGGKIIFADMSGKEYDITRMLAITEELKGDSILYYENIYFAIQEREQLQLEVYSDLTDVITTIKGETHTYNYLTRNTVGRVKDETYNSIKYTQEIYPSDYAYKKELYQGHEFQNTEELEVYATYYIKIYNASNNRAQITELVNYYDKDYEEIVASAYSYNGEMGTISWNESSKYSKPSYYEDCKVAYTTSFEGITLEPWTQLNIAVRYKVGKDANRNIILGDKKVATEIYSYSSEEGVIDNLSKPGNIENREKDSDIAPVLVLEQNDKTRIIKGFTWEETVNAVVNGIKTGDGLFNEVNETKINNIEISLVEKVTTQDGNKQEYTLAQMNSGLEILTYIDNSGNIKYKRIAISQGEYEFNDIIPGNYIVRFTYGENSVDFTYNGQDYKSTITRGIEIANASDAKDNKPRRKELLEIAKTMRNDVANILTNPDVNPEEYRRLTAMFADTENLYMQIENDNNKTNSIDFGLVKRPETKLQITKEIQNIKLTNQNLILIDTANGVNTGVIKIKDMTHKELIKSFIVMMDDELLHGAELTVDYKIEVKNIGDKDNLANYFEYDPAYGTRAQQDRIFTTSASKVYDYSNSLVSPKTQNPDWEEERDYSILAQSVQEKIGNKNYKVLSTEKLNTPLEPGESATVNLTLKRIISVSNDDMQYLNEVEIVERQNDGSRRDEEAEPGNYVPGDEATKQRDSWDTDVTVTNPTGTRSTYYWLILIIIAILGIGILLIKKIVVDKK